MLLLAIDPGPDHSALVRWTGARVEFAREMPNHELLLFLRHGDAFVGREPTLVIEKVTSYGMPVGAPVFETVWWSGRFAEAWFAATGGDVARMEFSDVRLELCHARNAKESHVRRALLDRIGEPTIDVGVTRTGKVKRGPNPVYGGQTVSGHCWSALALAVAYGVRREM